MPPVEVLDFGAQFLRFPQLHTHRRLHAAGVPPYPTTQEQFFLHSTLYRSILLVPARQWKHPPPKSMHLPTESMEERAFIFAGRCSGPSAVCPKDLPALLRGPDILASFLGQSNDTMLPSDHLPGTQENPLVWDPSALPQTLSLPCLSA